MIWKPKKDSVEDDEDDEKDEDEEVEDEEDNKDDDVEEDDEVEKEVQEGDYESETDEECEGCGKEQFFDFVFEAENFLDSETEKEMEESLNAVIRRFNKDNAIDEDDTDFAEEVVDIVKDLNGCCKHFAEEGSTFFKHCSKRKIMALSHMANWMFNKRIIDNTIKFYLSIVFFVQHQSSHGS